MASHPRSRRAASGAGAALMLAAGAATGLVLADLETTLPGSATAAEPAPAAAPAPAQPSAPPTDAGSGATSPQPAGPSLRPAPAPQNPPVTGLQPDAMTRAS